MANNEKYGFFLIKAGTNSIEAIRQTSSEFTLEQLRTLTDSRYIEVVNTVYFNDYADFDNLQLVYDIDGEIKGKKRYNEIASFLYCHPIFGDVVLCRGKRRRFETPYAYPFDLSQKWDAFDYFRVSQILPAYAEFIYALKDMPTDEDLHDIFGLPLQSDDTQTTP